MDQVIQKANEQEDFDTLFVISQQMLDNSIYLSGTSEKTIKDNYFNIELPLAVKETAEELYPRWKYLEGDKNEIDNLVEEAVILLIKKAILKQIHLFYG